MKRKCGSEPEGPSDVLSECRTKGGPMKRWLYLVCRPSLSSLPRRSAIDDSIVYTMTAGLEEAVATRTIPLSIRRLRVS
jgi:hypothetical protein